MRAFLLPGGRCGLFSRVIFLVGMGVSWCATGGIGMIAAVLIAIRWS